MTSNEDIISIRFFCSFCSFSLACLIHDFSCVHGSCAFLLLSCSSISCLFPIPLSFLMPGEFSRLVRILWLPWPNCLRRFPVSFFRVIFLFCSHWFTFLLHVNPALLSFSCCLLPICPCLSSNFHCFPHVNNVLFPFPFFFLIFHVVILSFPCRFLEFSWHRFQKRQLHPSWGQSRFQYMVLQCSA